MFEEPELHVVRFEPDESFRIERERQKAESRRRVTGRLTLRLIELGVAADDATTWSESLLDLLVVHRREDGAECVCSCHPRIPESDFHDYGDACPCKQTAEERKRFWDAWMLERDEYWESEEGRAEEAQRQADEDELISWIASQPDVVVSSYGGVYPEQWRGSVAGRSFYFRERHGEWRIELDLRPSGHFSRVWVGGDFDSEESFEAREIETGDVIARGVVEVNGYGRSPVERGQFIVEQIRDHIRRSECDVHTRQCDDIVVLLGGDVQWCPRCGTRLDN